jgi:hypothetical protein
VASCPLGTKCTLTSKEARVESRAPLPPLGSGNGQAGLSFPACKVQPGEGGGWEDGTMGSVSLVFGSPSFRCMTFPGHGPGAGGWEFCKPALVSLASAPTGMPGAGTTSREPAASTPAVGARRGLGARKRVLALAWPRAPGLSL